MFWLRLFWIESIGVPIYFLWLLMQAPADAPYRLLNLIVWTATLVAAVGSFAWTRRKKPDAATSEGAS